MKLIVESDGPVTTIAIARPAVKNAIDAETAAELGAAVSAFEADPQARIAVLAGEGGCFCAGWDLKSLAEEPLARAPDAGAAARAALALGPDGPGALAVCRRVPSKPVFAAIDGYAVAGGLELALWCDLRVMEEDAQLGVFCRRWGVPLIDGGTVRLPRLIGQSRALDMILTGRPVGAAEALTWGLANRVVPRGRARESAQELAREIARFPNACMLADRASCHDQWGRSLPDAFAAEATGGLPVLGEAVDGARRFASGLGRGGDFGAI